MQSSKFLDMPGLKAVLEKVNAAIMAAHTDATLPATKQTTGLVCPGDGIDVDENGVIAVRIIADDEISQIWDDVLSDIPERPEVASA